MTNFEQMMDGLQQDVQVPETIWNRYTDTLASLPEKQTSMQTVPMGTKSRRRSFRRVPKVAAVAAVIVVLLAGAVGASVYYHWNHGLAGELQLDENQKAMAEQSGLAAFPAAAGGEAEAQEDGIVQAADANAVKPSATDQGITITADTTLVDNYMAYVSFTISGYGLEEDAEPSVDLDAAIDGVEEYNWSGGFYDGWHSDAYGYAVNEDGIRMADMGEVTHSWRDENGNYIYLMYFNTTTKGAFVGKDIHVKFKGLGYAPGKAEHTTLVDGSWELAWTLSGATDELIAAPQAPIGDTGATLTEIELSPISVRVTLDWPRHMHEEEVIDENGESVLEEFPDDPPFFSGVRLKDGTLLPNLWGTGGTMGYTDDNSNEWIDTMGLESILDVSQVDAVLFFKDEIEDGQPITEDLFYVIPID